MADRDLTARQRSFVDEYSSGGMKNASEAYRRAYPSSRKWSNQVVAVEASRLLKHPKIALILQEIREKTDRALTRTIDNYAISKESLIEELASIAYAELTDYVSWDSQGHHRTQRFGRSARESTGFPSWQSSVTLTPPNGCSRGSERMLDSA